MIDKPRARGILARHYIVTLAIVCMLDVQL